MELEKQVPTLELCKRLKELGYPQEGLFWWRVGHSIKSDSVVYTSRKRVPIEATWMANYIVAPTVAEMGEMLYTIKIDLWLYHNAGQFHLQSYRHDFDVYEETEADARAKMSIYLLEKKLINLKGE